MSHYKISHYGEGSIPTKEDQKSTVFSVCKEAPTKCPPGSNDNVYADDESLLTIDMWKPLAVLCVQLAFLNQIETYSHGILIPAIVSVAYVSFIVLGTRFMKSRKPLALKGWMFSYNLYQVCLNVYTAVCIVHEVYHLGFSIWGNKASAGSDRLRFLLFLHYQNKYAELADTVFMVLRKKYDQVTTLHVYHHLLLLWSWFMVINIAPGSDAYFGALINSVTHVFLYGYYTLALLNIECPWKIGLTSLQILQFVVCSVHAMFCMFRSDYPRVLLYLDIFVQTNMLILFGRFFCSTYGKARKSTKEHKIKSKKTKFTLQEIQRHKTPNDCWCAIHGKVLDVTTFLDKHPGGDVIALVAGREATVLAETYHVNGIPKNVLEKYQIGELDSKSTSASYYSWDSEFYKTLRRRVVKRIRERKRSRRGGFEIWFKACLILITFFAGLIAMCVVPFGIMSFVLAALVGMASMQIGVCIQHDGNHGAFAESRILNRLAGWTLDLISASAFTWEIQHVLGHHAYTNLVDFRDEKQSVALKTQQNPSVAANASVATTQQEESDPDVFGSFPFVRMHPVQPRFWYHRYQHIYAPFLFALMTLSKVLQQDFEVIFNWKLLHIDATCRYSVRWNRIRFWFMKLASSIYMLVLPMYFHGPLQGLSLWIVSHLVCGETLASLFIVNHMIENVSYAAVSSDNKTARPMTREGRSPMTKSNVPENDWAAVQCQTSVNWSSGSVFWNHFSGGLCHQIEHHLFPGICHTNYVHIHPVVRDTCKEFGVPYQSEPSLYVAYFKMLRHLRSLGCEDGGDCWRKFRSDASKTKN